MIKVTYGIVEERYTLGNESRVSYGISAYSDANENGTATIVSSVHDITSNKESLARLVDDCNRLKLSTVHLHDVVEDFLSDQCTIKKQVQENLHISISKERVFLSQIGLLSSENAALGGFIISLIFSKMLCNIAYKKKSSYYIVIGNTMVLTCIVYAGATQTKIGGSTEPPIFISTRFL